MFVRHLCHIVKFIQGNSLHVTTVKASGGMQGGSRRWRVRAGLLAVRTLLCCAGRDAGGCPPLHNSLPFRDSMHAILQPKHSCRGRLST